MVMNIAGAVAAYANAAKSVDTSGAAKAGGGFADLLQSTFNGVVTSQQQSEAASLAATTGKADLANVVTAVNNAEMTLQTVLAVRDKVISAYTEIMHMAV